MSTIRRTASFLAACLALASAPAAARADQPGSGADTKVAEGEALAEQAYGFYKEGRYSEAVAAYLRAYEMTGSSIILFNVGNLYDRKLRELDLAAEYYRRYLRAPDADPEFVRKANDRLDAIRQQAERAPNAGAAAPVGRSAEPPPERGRDPIWRTTGLLIGGLGVASLGVSTFFALRARSKDSEADKFCDQKVCSDPRGASLGDDAVSAANLSTYTLAGGLLGLAAGATLYLAAPSRAPSTSARALRVTPSAGPQTAGVVLVGRW